jgi:amino acid transporter
LNFDAKKAFDFPPGAFNFSAGLLLGLGAAARVGVYDYLGYYDICYIGDEVRDPGRVVPRSILISLVAVALIYIGINLSIIGVIPWREFVIAPGATATATSKFVVSVFLERLLGRNLAMLFTGLILWTAVGSIFALMLGYSRIPYAAALDGYFFRVFGKLHPTKQFPYVSLLFIGVISIICTLFPLGMVIDALITTRILIQFVGQAAGVMLLRQRLPANMFPFRMWFYPLPCAVAILGWTFIFATTNFDVILVGVGTLWLGLVAFFIWSYRNRTWPFGIQETYRRPINSRLKRGRV